MSDTIDYLTSGQSRCVPTLKSSIAAIGTKLPPLPHIMILDNRNELTFEKVSIQPVKYSTLPSKNIPKQHLRVCRYIRIRFSALQVIPQVSSHSNVVLGTSGQCTNQFYALTGVFQTGPKHLQIFIYMAWTTPCTVPSTHVRRSVEEIPRSRP